MIAFFAGGLLDGTGMSLLLLGFVLGLKHALDADHLIAVSTIVSERRGMLSSGVTGALWGVGHTTALLFVGVVIIALDLQIPERVALAMEMLVAFMLILLGINLLRQLLKGGTVHHHIHSHNGTTHIHPHLHTASVKREHTTTHSHQSLGLGSLLQLTKKHIRKGRRSILIGMIHGMAGSAALMLIVLAAIPSVTLRLLYITVFGIGSSGGMLVMSMLIGIPFVVTAGRFEKLNIVVRGFAATLSVGFGVYFAWQVGIVEGLIVWGN